MYCNLIVYVYICSMQSSNKLNFEIAIANLPIIYIYVLFKDCYTILKSTHVNLQMDIVVV